MKGVVKVLLESEDAGAIDPGMPPVVLTATEYKAWEARSKGKLLCVHDWQPRLALPMGGFEITYWDRIEVCNFPAGRFCAKCGKADLSHADGATEMWGRRDFLA